MRQRERRVREGEGGGIEGRREMREGEEERLVGRE